MARPVTSGSGCGSGRHDNLSIGAPDMTSLDLTRVVVLGLHLTAVAVVLGAWLLLLSRRAKRLWPMVLGAAVGAGSGVVLVAVRQTAGLPVDYPKIAVKLVVALLVLGAVTVVAVRRRGAGPGSLRPDSRGWLSAAGGLAVLNVVIAVAW